MKIGEYDMKIAIVGSRDATLAQYQQIKENVPDQATSIISGGAKGADRLAAKYAAEKMLPLIEYLPDYKTFGSFAPLMRNQQIIMEADYVVCLWNGFSKGTASVIRLCMKLHKPCKVIPFTPAENAYEI